MEETTSNSDYVNKNKNNDDDDSLLNSDKKMGLDETDPIYQMMFYNDENEKKKNKVDDAVTTDENVKYVEITNTEVSNHENTNGVDLKEEVTSEATSEANFVKNTKVMRLSSRKSLAERNETDYTEFNKSAIDNPIPAIDLMLGKRPKLTCSMVKLRQLSFIAPMTLAEVSNF